jgi:signal peptide peptidase SppA
MSLIEKTKKTLQPFLKDRIKPKVAVICLSGVISSDGRLGRGLNLAGVAGAIKQAFELSELKAVALAINSPGGSPVQSNLILKRIRALADEKDIPVYAFAEDVAASGGYMLALAADEIYADPSSIVGSIGVISAGFGFDKAIEKFGVERRIYTAGENKSTLDPFSPEKPEDVERLKRLQLQVHETFKDIVRDRRGDRLKGEDSELFTGEFWAGAEAAEKGLIDGLADMRSFCREKFGDKIKLVPVSQEKSFWKRGRGIGMESEIGSGSNATSGLLRPSAKEAMISLEERSLWSQFGL